MSAKPNQSDVSGVHDTKEDDQSKDSEEDQEDELEEGEGWEDESDDEEDGNSHDDEEDDDEAEDGKPSTREGTGRSRKQRRKRRRVISALQEGKWQQMFQKLLQYHQKHGNCLVPNRYSKDTSLGAWVATQRRNYRMFIAGSGESSGMTADRVKSLEDLGFRWTTTDPRHEPWEVRYAALQEFVEKYGHAEIPMRWEENLQLSNWVSKQRQDYKLREKGKSSRLTDERLRLLNAVGFKWHIPRKGRKIKLASIPVVKRPNQSSTTGVTRGNGIVQPQVRPIPAPFQQTGTALAGAAGTSFMLPPGVAANPAAMAALNSFMGVGASPGVHGSLPGYMIPNGNGGATVNIQALLAQVAAQQHMNQAAALAAAHRVQSQNLLPFQVGNLMSTLQQQQVVPVAMPWAGNLAQNPSAMAAPTANTVAAQTISALFASQVRAEQQQQQLVQPPVAASRQSTTTAPGRSLPHNAQASYFGSAPLQVPEQEAHSMRKKEDPPEC